MWVVGFGRSGTTLLEDVLVQAAESRGPVFAVFEPCHPEDVFRGRPVGTEDTQVMLECMRRALRCDFADLTMHADSYARTRINYVGLGKDLGSACRTARTRVFKTIYPMPTELAVLEPEVPRGAKILRVARDPRTIYHSMLHTRGFPKYSQDFPTLLCATMGRWVAEASPLLKQVIYEDLVRHPEQELSQILDFLAWKESKSMATWIHKNLGAKACGQSVERVLQDKLQAFRDQKGDETVAVTSEPLRYSQCKTKEDIARSLCIKTLPASERQRFKTDICSSALWAYSYESVRPPVNVSRAAALYNGTATAPLKVPRLRPRKGRDMRSRPYGPHRVDPLAPARHH